MPYAIEKTEKWAREYDQSQQSAWDSVKHEHDQAMVAMTVQDVVDYGIFLLKTWVRHASQWHDAVSQDAKHYDATVHKAFQTVNALVAVATKGTIGLVDIVKDWDYDIEGEDQFRELAGVVLGSAIPPQQTFNNKAFRALGREALREYETGRTEPIDHWGA